jgi:glutathione S-transferase
MVGAMPAIAEPGMSETDIVLHHYPRSPFAEKVRLAFGFKGLAWCAVEQPRMAPKPGLTALTGGYRRIPVMQIGADIYCDTKRILRELERRHPSPTIFPAASAGRAEMLAAWADHHLFADSLGLVFGLHGDRFPPELHADRARFTAGKFDRWDSVRMKARVPDLRVQFGIHLAWLEQALSDGRPCLTGDALSVADLAAYHPLWYARGNLGDEAGLDAYPQIVAWLARLDAIGHGAMTEMTPEAALATARNAGPAALPPSDAAGTFRIGMRLTVMPDDWGFDPVEGELVAIDRDSVTLRRDDAVVGTVHVHFPRDGFTIRPAIGQ